MRGRPRATRGRCFAQAGLRALLAAAAPELPCSPGASGWVAGGRWARGGSCGLGFCFVVRRDVPTPVPGPRGVSGGAWVALWAAASPGASENTVKIVRGSRSCRHPSPRSPAKSIKIKQLFWSTDRGRTRLCLRHSAGGQRGPGGRRPGGTFRWSGSILGPTKS